MVSKLSENGIAGFILANGALSGGGEEYKIRRKLIENNLVEAIMVLPQDMFYTTNISVTVWILNKNKKEQTRSIGDETRHYRDREKEILFMDLRQIGEPFEKKFTQFSEADIRKVAKTYHDWQTTAPMINDELLMVNDDTASNINHLPLTIYHYKNIPEYCYSASFDEVAKKDFSLVPSKYIEFVNRDENINFDDKMKALQAEFDDLL